MPGLHTRSFLRMIRRDWEIYSLQFVTLSIAFTTAIIVISFCVREFNIGNEYADNTVRILLRNEAKAFEGRNRLSNRIPDNIYQHLVANPDFRNVRKTEDFSVYADLNSLNLDDAEVNLNKNVGTPAITYRLQYVRDIYFGPRAVGENAKHGDMYCVLILTCIGGLILILAVTNFVNLVSLTLPARAKEIAMRKVAGANRSPLLGLLAKESGMVVLISLSIAAVLLVWFNEWLQELSATTAIILVTLFAAIAAAPLIPAWAFVKASPGRLLGTDTITFPRMKRAITVIQLGVSISLIIASLVINRQITRSLIKEPGKNHDQVVYTKWPANMTRQYLNRLKNDWPRDNASIVNLTAVSHTPDNIQSKPIGENFYQLVVDYDFKEFFRLEMSNGRWFGPMDYDSIVVNEAAGVTHNNSIGTIQNFSRVYNLPDKPIHFSVGEGGETNFIMIRIIEVDIRKTLQTIERSFSEISGRPTAITFLDKNYAETLAYEDRLNKLCDMLSLVGIVMACCAIYALSLSRMRDNLKQIAIRKTFGASNSQIVGRLSRQFLELMLGSLFFFGPVTYFLLQEWLRNFAYAARFTWSDPIISIGICLVIVLIVNLLMLTRINSGSLKDLLRR